MKFAFGCLILLFALFGGTESICIRDCSYVDNDRTSIEVTCANTSPVDECFSDHFGPGTETKNLEIQSLKYASTCSGDHTFRFMLKDLTNLKSLNMSHSGREYLDSYEFYDLENLNSLDLSFNKISWIGRTTFWSLTNLKYLNLSNNLIGEIDVDLFNENPQLEVLRLENNRILYVVMYRALVNLKTLDASNNRLWKVFFTRRNEKFSSLETLNLEGNRLRQVDTVTPSTFPKLRTLGISRNRFSCQYLATFLSPQWESLGLASKTSDDTHMHGIDCQYEAEATTPIVTEN